MGAVTVRAATASLNLSYQLVTGENSAVAVDEVVNLRSTKTSLAGIRRWFECPGCHRRSRILYGPRFRCRLCHGLSYESQFESRAQRTNRRARKIRRRLGGSDCLNEADGRCAERYLQDALDSLVAKGLPEIIGYREGKPVCRATSKAMGTTARG